MDLGLRVVGDRRVALRFDQFPQIARDKFTEVVTKYQALLQSQIEAGVPKKSGKLAASLTGGVETGNPNKVRGWVNLGGKDKKLILQAMALEYGSNKNIKVSSKAGRGLSTVYGHYISPIEVLVGAYTRTSNILAVRFMRGPLAAIAGPFLDDMQNALVAATTEGA